jgi:hypothetical protein
MSSAQISEGYARLPEDLLQDLLAGAGDMVTQVEALLGPALERKAELRQGLQDLGLLRTYNDVAPLAVAGVDGGFAVERTAAVDIVLSVGVGVEGLSTTTTSWDGTQYEWWARAGNHDIDVERLARGTMVAQELAIIAGAPHDLRILDGSHLTLVIQLNSALTAFSPELREEARTTWDRLKTAQALTEAAVETTTVAMPKYDSSREICHVLSAHVGFEIPGDDKYLLGVLLEPGELLQPQQVSANPWASLHFDAREKADEDIRDAFEAAIEPLRQRQISFTYFKPDELSPAFRIELKRATTDQELDGICSTIASQITGPFVREPYPQYLADVMAKSVGLGLAALKTAVQLGLSGIGKPEIAEILVQSYRTEGV